MKRLIASCLLAFSITGNAAVMHLTEIDGIFYNAKRFDVEVHTLGTWKTYTFDHKKRKPFRNFGFKLSKGLRISTEIFTDGPVRTNHGIYNNTYYEFFNGTDRRIKLKTFGKGIKGWQISIMSQPTPVPLPGSLNVLAAALLLCWAYSRRINPCARLSRL